MHWLLHLSGLAALLVICGVLFVEECGVPLPVLPGDGLLVLGGILVGAGKVEPVLFFALATVAMVSGALIGHAWSGAVGGPALRRAAERLGGARHFEAARSRLLGAGPWGVLVCRLVPGVRVYTNLVAGAAGVSRRTFATGLVPGVLAWVVGFGTLGILVGHPVERFLLASRGGMMLTTLLVVIIIIALVAARYLPPRRTSQSARPPSMWRLSAAVLLDISLVAAAASIGTEIVESMLRTGELQTVLGVALLLAVGSVVYVTASRRTGGATAGEGVFRVSYRRRREPQPVGRRPSA
jgi:membrane-associated protein